jgi:hypothetical protein
MREEELLQLWENILTAKNSSKLLWLKREEAKVD